MLAEPQGTYYKFCPWGGTEKLGQAGKSRVSERLQGNAGTYKEPQYDEGKKQKLVLRLVGSGEDGAAPRAGREVRH